MSLDMYQASVPVFAAMLRNMSAWLDKAAGEKPERDLMEARLAPDMKPLPAQYQIASDSAKNAVARLCGIEAPAMADEETSFAELKERCDRTIAYVESIERAAFEHSDTREILIRFPGGLEYRTTGRDYLTGFALPNFYFHASTAYAIMRASGVTLGKLDYLQHLAPQMTRA